MTLRLFWQIAAVIFLSTSLIIAEAQAEDVQFGVVKFKIDQVEQVSDTESRIVVAGKELLVPALEWKAYALEQCLISRCYKFSLSELLTLATAGDSVSERASSSLPKALERYIKKEFPEEQIDSFLRAQVLTLLSVSIEKAGAFVRSICDADIDLGNNCTELAALTTRLDLVNSLSKKQPKSALVLLLSTFSNNAELQRFSAVVLDLLRSVATESKDSGSQFLRLFSLLPKELLTPDMLQLLEQQLVAIAPTEIQSEDIENLVSTHSTVIFSNSLLVNRIATILDSCVARQHELGDFDRASAYLNIWESLMAMNSNLEGKNLVSLYVWLGRFGRNELATELYSRLKPQLGLKDRLRLFAIEYMPRLNFWLVFLLTVLLGFLVIALIISMFFRRTESSDTFTKRLQAEMDDQPRQVFSVGALAMSPKMSRYKECLRSIGLEGSASVKEIKAAYRSAVKASHPDLKSGAADGANDHANSDKFIDLTKAYDEALSLHRELAADEERL
jgi:hypothetical protein